MNITRGRLQTAKKIVLYGVEGIGKSTFAAQFPGAVFIDTEGSTAHMDVARFDTPTCWADILAAVEWTNEHPDQIGTLVIDTMDWAEKFATRYVCREEVIDNKGNTRDWDSIETPGYGKGYVYLKAAIQGLLDRLNALAGKGVNVVLTAHALLRKFEQPDEMGSYDRWALKLNEKNVAPIVKEWADMVLFANYRTDVVKAADGTNKARGGQKRIMYTQHSACWDAKNRFNLDDPLPFEYGYIAHLFEEREPARESHSEAGKEAEPAEAPAKVTAPKAEVTTAERLPEEALTAKKRKAKPKDPEIPEARPEMMHSDNPEKDAALEELWQKMRAGGIGDPLVVMAVVADKDYYDITTKIRDYDLEFIRDVLIEAWDQVRSMCLTKINDLPF